GGEGGGRGGAARGGSGLDPHPEGPRGPADQRDRQRDQQVPREAGCVPRASQRRPPRSTGLVSWGGLSAGPLRWFSPRWGRCGAVGRRANGLSRSAARTRIEAPARSRRRPGLCSVAMPRAVSPPDEELADELVGADRVARVRFAAGRTDRVESPPLEVRSVSTDRVADLAMDALLELTGERPRQVPDLPRPVDALREWAEWREVLRTIEEAGAGDLVLVDGSLHGGPLVPPDVVRRAHRRAVERGVQLAGVVKASTLYWGRNAPLVTLVKRRGDRELGATPWAARISTDPVFGRLYVGEIFIAHLAATASYAFRVDVARAPLDSAD